MLILALLALALVIYELGEFLVELHGRRRRRFGELSTAPRRLARRCSPTTATARTPPSMASPAARRWPRRCRSSSTHARTDGGEHQLNKALADFDFDAQRRLGRTRMLVRAGPALGLMGTLIPLSPALTGLANGNTAALSHDLRVAFSVTVVGLMIGAVAFGISLSRDRLYGQDLSDLEYVAATRQ